MRSRFAERVPLEQAARREAAALRRRGEEVQAWEGCCEGQASEAGSASPPPWARAMDSRPRSTSWGGASEASETEGPGRLPCSAFGETWGEAPPQLSGAEQTPRTSGTTCASPQRRGQTLRQPGTLADLCLNALGWAESLG